MSETELIKALEIVLSKADELDADISACVGRKFSTITRDKLSHRLSGITYTARRAIEEATGKWMPSPDFTLPNIG